MDASEGCSLMVQIGGVTRASIDQLYQRRFGRNADAEGKAHFQSILDAAAGKSIAEQNAAYNSIDSALVNSKEFKDRQAENKTIFNVADHDNNPATANVLVNNPGSTIKFDHNVGGGTGVSRVHGSDPYTGKEFEPFEVGTRNGLADGLFPPPIPKPEREGYEGRKPEDFLRPSYDYKNEVDAYSKTEADPLYQIDRAINPNSPLIQRAITQGRQFANSRGLLNSSVAAEAANNAVLDVAVPIGSQAAAQAFGANQSYRDYREAFDLQRAALENSNFQLGQRLDFEGTQAGLNRELQREDTGIRVGAAERSDVANNAYRADALYAQAISDINRNTNLSAEAREDQLAAARDRYNSAISLAESLYDVELAF